MAFRGYLKQSTQVTKTVYMESNAAPRVGVTGLAAGITKYISKAGAAAASATMATAELDNTNMTGVYTVVITAAQTDTLGELSVKLVAAGANHVNDTWEVVSYLPGEAALVQNGTASGQISTSSGQVLVQNGTGSGQLSTSSGQVLVQSGTGTGQVSLSSGLVKLQATTHTGAVIPTVTLTTTTTTVTDLTTTANAEPTSVPASNASIADKIAWLFTLARNKITQTSTTQTVLANDNATTVGTSTVSDDATTFTRGKFA